jgi:hypothetical protein
MFPASTALTIAATAVAATSVVGTSTAPASRIYAAAQNTCLDTSTTDPAHYFLDTYGHPCDGAASQSFSFRAVSGAPAHTYEIISVATGQCMTKFRGAIRQSACAGSVPPDPAAWEWTLQPVGTVGNQYLIELTSTLTGGLQPTCVQVRPQPPGYPGLLFEYSSCDTADSGQIMTLASGL